jgi:hypothetical protein
VILSFKSYKYKKDAVLHASFFFVTRFGETDNGNRLSCAKHKIKYITKQEKIAFYRFFLLFIELIDCKELIFNN